MLNKSAIILTLLALCVFNTPVNCQQALDADKVASLKALFVYHFTRFTRWPDDVFADKSSPLVVGVIGRNTLEGVLELAVKDKQVDDHPITVKRLEYPALRENDPKASLTGVLDELKRCHVLIVGRSDDYPVETVVQALGNSDVLTVSDVPRFIDRGGMIGLLLRDNRVQFDINRSRVEQTRLRVSSKLLRLAGVVK